MLVPYHTLNELMKNKITLAASRSSINIFLDACKNKLKKGLWALGQNAFLFILIFIVTGILLGEFVFYKYVLVVELQDPQIVDISVKFHENVYNTVLKEWQVRSGAAPVTPAP